MILHKVEFTNYRPFYGKVTTDLSPLQDKNIILIGGRNGQGKTSFLIGLVWCLYGRMIDSVDPVFREEVKGNYSRFLNRSLNWTAKKEGKNNFSVQIQFTDISLLEELELFPDKVNSVTLKRSYSIGTGTEEVTLLFDGQPHPDLQEEEELRFFIQDYLIPIELAKFIFFDAEKIADIASLGVKDRASLMNKTFGQVLGLSPYEDLIVDLENFEKELKKKEAKGPIETEIHTIEKAIEGNEKVLKQIEERLSELDEQDDSLRQELSELTNQLISRGNVIEKADVDSLNRKRNEIEKEYRNVQSRFQEIEQILPFALIAHRMDEIKEALEQERQSTEREIQRVGFSRRLKAFADQLFNKPPFPEEDMEFEQKVFYFEKAKDMLSVLAGQEGEESEPEFFHELDRSEVEHFDKVFDLVRRYSFDFIEGTFRNYIRLQNELRSIEGQIRAAEGEAEDEIALDLQAQKVKAEKDREDCVIEKGKLQNQQERLRLENEKLNGKLNKYLRRVKASKEVQDRIKRTEQYLKVLREFVKQQKEEKKVVLQENLLREFQSLFHKSDFINRVEVNILRKNMGMEVTLYDKDNREISPGSDMSKGEQQLYASGLLKSILSESISNLPIFIDTPLGRLDQEHRDNILAHYYPTLANQVVILSTNTEIRASDLPRIESQIARKHLLENVNNRTSVKSGYFK